MARTLRVEAPEGLTLKAYLYPEDGGAEGDVAGYNIIENDPRNYEVEITDALIFGLYRVMIELTDGALTVSIDSGYVRFAADAGTYTMTNDIPAEEPETITSDTPTYSNYGPKRVKTKEMEIEQFSPSELQRVEERTNATLPSFSTGQVDIGRVRGTERPWDRFEHL